MLKGTERAWALTAFTQVIHIVPCFRSVKDAKSEVLSSVHKKGRQLEQYVLKQNMNGQLLTQSDRTGKGVQQEGHSFRPFLLATTRKQEQE